VNWVHLAWNRVEWRAGVSWPPKQVPVLACQEESGTCNQIICHKTDSKLNSRHGPLVKFQILFSLSVKKKKPKIRFNVPNSNRAQEKRGILDITGDGWSF